MYCCIRNVLSVSIFDVFHFVKYYDVLDIYIYIYIYNDTISIVFYNYL